jgi:uncharacterized protein YjiK
MIRQSNLLTLLIISLLTGCQPARKSGESADTTTETAGSNARQSAPLPYNLTKPTERYDLPAVLREVSGLSYYKPGKLACVQDELGSIFIYDLAKRRVASEQVFGPKGDFEGVEFVNGNLYVLRADGEIYYVEPDESSIKTLGGGPQTHHIKIDLPDKNDIEGLGYDPKLNALLLATKNAKRHGSDKQIYFYGLEAKALYQGPRLKQADLQAFGGSGDKEIQPSGIAVHPQTRDYYVLASQGHRLVVLTSGGTLRAVLPLDKSLFAKPEGITFAPDGTLFIASEGDGGKGYILQFATTAAPGPAN